MSTEQRAGDMSVPARLHLAEAAEGSGDRDTAVAMYLAAAQAAPEDSAVQVQVATALVRNDRLAPARDLLLARLKVAPNDADVLRVLASIQLMQGQSAQAMARLDAALATNPADSSALVNKAVALDMQGRHAEAQAIYHQVLARAPGDIAALNNLAISLLVQGRATEALAVLAPLGEGDDLPMRTRVNLGVIYAANGQMAQARSLLQGRISDENLQELVRAVVRMRTQPAPAG